MLHVKTSNPVIEFYWQQLRATLIIFSDRGECDAAHEEFMAHCIEACKQLNAHIFEPPFE